MKRIKILLLLTTLAVLSTGCTQKEGNIAENHGGIIAKETTTPSDSKKTTSSDTQAQEPSIQTTPSDSADTSNQKAQVYEGELKTILEENKKATYTQVEYENILYEILDVQMGKNIGTHKKENINFWNEQIDEKGNLLSSEQYVWITMKIKNLSEGKKEFLVNKSIVIINDSNIVTETAAEARYINPEQGWSSPQKRFHCLLESGEEKEIEIGYIVSEELATDSLYFCIGSGGSQLDNPNNTYLYLGEFTNEE